MGPSGKREVVRRTSWAADAEERVFPQWMQVIEAKPVSDLVVVLSTERVPGNDQIQGVVSCTLDGTCWRSADWSTDAYLFVQPNQG